MKALIKKDNLLYYIVAIILVGLLLFGTFYDLEISKKIVTEPNPFNIFFESFGWIVGYSFVPFLTCLFFFKRTKSRPLAYLYLIIGNIIGILGYTLTLKNGIDYLVEKNVMKEINIFLIALIGLILTLITYFIGYYNRRHYNKMVALTFITLALFITYLIGVELILKPLFSRTRFDDMNGVYDSFTNWYIRGNGGSSFPSGHTALSAIILFICCLPDIFKNMKINKKVLYIISLLYIALMAFARIQIGRHFLSDVVFSIIYMHLGFLIIVKSKAYKKYVLYKNGDI